MKISSVLPVQQWSSPDEQEREFAVRSLKRTIEITAELEVPVLNTEFAGDKFQPLVSQGQWYKSMAELAPVFEKIILSWKFNRIPMTSSNLISLPHA